MEVFAEFKKDAVFEPFLSEEFDVQSHTTELVQGVVIADHLNKLSLGLSRVESELEQHVGGHYEELLSQAAGIDTLENSLSAIQTRTQTLQAGVERVRARIVDPYNKLHQQTLVLSRLQSTCELLRRVIRCLVVTKKLKTQLENCPRDLSKAASSISELEDLYSDGELIGLTVLAGSEEMAANGRKEVETQARQMLQSGSSTYNQTMVGTGLQVFYNLGNLGASVEKVVDGLLNTLHDTIVSTLDTNRITNAVSSTSAVKGPGKSVLPALGQTSKFRSTLWSGLEKMMDEIYNTILQTHHLHKVLSKKRDPMSHVVFLQQVEDHCGKDLFSRVWSTITSDLTRNFSQAAKGSHFIRQALEVDYPMLVRLYGDLWRRLENITGEMRRPIGDENDNPQDIAVRNEAQLSDPESLLRASLLPLESAFLSRSLSRLFDPVNLMFSTPDTPPTKQECDSLIKTIASEINVSCVDANLSENVARNVLKCIQLLCTKCEQMMPTDAEAIQVIGPATDGQKMLFATVNQLLYLRSQLERSLSASLSHLSLTTKSLTTLQKTIPAIEAVMTTAITPLFSEIKLNIDNILLTMHQEDFSSNVSSDTTPQCSLYLKELQTFLARAHTDYIAPFHSSTIVRENVERLATRCLTMFIWSASLIRPIGDTGKLRLAGDFAQLEEGITILCPKPSELGDAYRMVRSVRPLLFLTPEHMIQVSSVGELMPHSLILHFLFARAPKEIKSPHQSANWSVGQYLTWLDSHPSESERLELIAGTLESYAASVSRAGQTHYATVYPVMMEAMEEGRRRLGKRSK